MSSGASASRPRVVVVGGGLSGLSAAIACLDAGAGVTLLEARPRLGGATWSFDRKGLQFDNVPVRGTHGSAGSGVPVSLFPLLCTSPARFSPMST
jgi:phytoene dehydrogenase-like protein